jgi:hypothetical protein
MIIKQWLGRNVDSIPGLICEPQPADRPHAPDWLVRYIHYDTVNRTYWIGGYLRRTGEAFHWGHHDGDPLDWRYDLTHAAYQVGRHETESEARQRKNKERLVST